MTDVTTVNDNTVEITSSGARTNRETAARRFAADLPRSDDRIREVSTSVVYDVTVWLDTDDIDERGSGLKFQPPRGYSIDKVFVGSNGGVAVGLNRTDG